MLVSVQEMEIICIFYNGSRAETISLMRHAATQEKTEARATLLSTVADKLDALEAGATVCLAFA